MPSAALKVCRRPGCARLSGGPYCDEHRKKPVFERRRFDRARSSDPIRRQYFTVLWASVRRVILARDPFCKLGILCGFKAVSTVVHHVIAARKHVAMHGGDLDRFYDESNLQGACKPCHDAHTAKECGWAGKK